MAYTPSWFDYGGLSLPDRIAISDVAYNPYSEQWSGDTMLPQFASIGLAPGYGNWSSGLVNNYNVSFDGFDARQGTANEMMPGAQAWNPDLGLKLKLKSADKEGTEISYKREGDYLVPDLGSYNVQQWDSNPNSAMALAVLAAPALMYGAQTLGAGALGGAETGATGATSAAASPWSLPVSQVGTAGLPISTAGSTMSMAGPSLGGIFGSGGISALGTALPSVAGAASSWQIPEGLKDPSTVQNLAKFGGLLAGGALGQPKPQEASGPRAVPQPIPTMYGGSQGLLGGWGAMGPTETERMMRQQYLPGLLGNGPWSQ